MYCIGSHQTKMYVTYLQIRHVYIYICIQTSYHHHIYSYRHIFACHTVMIILSFLPCSSIQLVNLGSCDSPLTPPKASRASANLRPARRVARKLQNDCLAKKTVIDLVKHGNVRYLCELQGALWHMASTWGHGSLMCKLTLIQMRSMCSFIYIACMD